MPRSKDFLCSLLVVLKLKRPLLALQMSDQTHLQKLFSTSGWAVWHQALNVRDNWGLCDKKLVEGPGDVHQT